MRKYFRAGFLNVTRVMSMNRRSKGQPCRPGGYGVLVQEALKRLLTLNNSFTQLLNNEGRFKSSDWPSPP